ncbi:MAG: T9SS type A sorting domain-containing protein [Bacteroidetes bacterium]|nr:T9SS type A sorting domain-containing protein [Bacteroidota bacterium]
MSKQIKNILLAYFVLISVFILPAQDYFSKRLSFYHPPTWNTTHSILPQNDGYVIVGITGDTVDFYWHQIGLLKIDLQGNEVWTKIVKSETGDYYCGYPGSTKMRADSTYFYAGSKGCISNDLFYHKGLLIKFDSNWDVIWINEYGDKIMPLDTSITFLQLNICPDSSMIVSGIEYYFGDNSKAILSKIDKEGKMLWTRRFSNGGINEGRSVVRASDGGYVLGNYRYIPGQSITADPIIYKTDSLGNTEWTKNLGGPYMDYYPTVNISQDGNITIATCYADSMFSIDKAYSRINVLKINNYGTIIWNNKYGVSSIRKFLQNIKNSYNETLISIGFNYTHEYPEVSGWVFKIDNDGDSLWYRQYYIIKGKDSENYFYDIVNTNDHGYMLGGYIYPIMPDTGTQDIWILKLDSVGCDTPGCDPTVGIKRIPGIKNKDDLFIFPNPASEEINCLIHRSFPSSTKAYGGGSSEGGSIYLYDIWGRLIESVKIPSGQSQIRIDVSDYTPGVYFVVLKEGKVVLGRKKVVVCD